MLQLKEYQQRTLDALITYFRACLQFNSASQAFYAVTEEIWYKTSIAYSLCNYIFTNMHNYVNK